MINFLPPPPPPSLSTYLPTSFLPFLTVSDSAQLSAGYFQLEQGSESQTALEEFFMEFRTWDSNAVLAQFGDAASLEVSQ